MSLTSLTSLYPMQRLYARMAPMLEENHTGHIESYRVIVTSQGCDRVAPPQGYYGTTATVRSLKLQDVDVSGEMVRNMVPNDAPLEFKDWSGV